MSKEKIFEKHSVTSTGAYQVYPEKYKILNAMDEYAKETAIGFTEWMARYKLYDSKHPYKYIGRQRAGMKLVEGEPYTAEQLYTLYLQTK